MANLKESGAEDARLRAAGFDPAAEPDCAVATLESLRGAPGVADGAIARALGEIPVERAAVALARMETRASGAARREIRRALFRLRQRGVEPPRSAEHAARAIAAAHAAEGETGLSALLSPADADGARVVWLMKTRPAGGLRRLWGLVSERDGMLGITLTPMPRKAMREDRAELERRAGVPMVEADWRVADFILCDAWRRTPEARRREAGNFFAVRAELIAAAPPAELDHPIYREFAGEIEHDPPADLMNEPEVGAFTFGPEAVRRYVEEIASLRNSVIVLNRTQQEERVVLVVERAIDELLSGENRIRMRRHLEDSAHYLALTGRRPAAAWAAAAAARLRDGAGMKRVPFFQAFIRAQLGAVIAQEEEQRREEPRLIMTPVEAMRARQAAMRRPR